MSQLGSITIVGMWEMNYVAGFNLRWWEFTHGRRASSHHGVGVGDLPVPANPALTMAQFFEIRYSRRFRIYAGLLAFVSGVVNFGIFPAVGARFFIYFCGLPLSVSILGISVGTFPLVMLLFLSIALFFVFAGGRWLCSSRSLFRGYLPIPFSRHCDLLPCAPRVGSDLPGRHDRPS